MLSWVKSIHWKQESKCRQNRSSWLKSSLQGWPVQVWMCLRNANPWSTGSVLTLRLAQLQLFCAPSALKSSTKASTLLPLTTSLALALPLGVIAMATGILVRSLFTKCGWEAGWDECWRTPYFLQMLDGGLKEKTNGFKFDVSEQLFNIYGSSGIGLNGWDLVRFHWCWFHWKVCFPLLCCWDADQIGEADVLASSCTCLSQDLQILVRLAIALMISGKSYHFNR